jgi:hypothetical protein
MVGIQDCRIKIRCEGEDISSKTEDEIRESMKFWILNATLKALMKTKSARKKLGSLA